MALLLALASMYIAGKVVAEVGRDATKIKLELSMWLIHSSPF